MNCPDIRMSAECTMVPLNWGLEVITIFFTKYVTLQIEIEIGKSKVLKIAVSHVVRAEH